MALSIAWLDFQASSLAVGLTVSRIIEGEEGYFDSPGLPRHSDYAFPCRGANAMNVSWLFIPGWPDAFRSRD